MNLKFFGNILLIFGLTVILAAFAAAAGPTGGLVNAGETEHGSGSASGTSTAYGGNVTQINVSGTAMTSRWTGFYGSISGNITLSDAASNNFYAWTITDFTGAVVYAANNSVSDWGLAALTPANAPIGVDVAATDSFNNTFTSTETFNSASINVNNVKYTSTYQSGVVGSLKTYALSTNSGNTNLWAGLAQNNVDSFKGSGTIVDYQILAPTKSAGTQYNFYLELP
jgi:hypothetical protein